MKIAVCVKHAVDEAELRIDSSGKPELSRAVGKMSVFDKNAVEESLRLKSSLGGEVTVFTLGTGDARKTLKEALAMGADKGVIIQGDTLALDALQTASILSAALKKSGPFDLVLCSEGSSDTYSGLVPPMLSEFLQIPYVGFARKLEVSGSVAKVERSLEDSVEVVEAPTPLVVSVVSEINEPRYPTLIQIMQASKKPIEETNEQELGILGAVSLTKLHSMSAQTTARKHIMIEGSPDEAAAKLVEELEKEGVLSR